MKSKIFEKYKLINSVVFVVLLCVLFFMNVNYTNWFSGPDALDFYKYFYAIYDPIYSGGKWLVVILGVLLLFPSRIFKKWLFFVAPPVLLLTYFLVQGISVYSGNLLNPTRAQMAENGMIVLAVITAVFVVISLLLDRKNKAN